MSGPGPIGVLGGTGMIGGAVASLLGERGFETLVAARRSGPKITDLFDVQDEQAVRSFVSRCNVVVDCTGVGVPARLALARRVAAAGAHFVTPAVVEGSSPWPSACMVHSAGVMPGLSEAIAATLVSKAPPPVELNVHIGGCDYFSASAAREYVDGAKDHGHRANSRWCRGGRVRDVRPREGVRDLAFFPGAVTVVPFLDPAAEDLAAVHGLHTLLWNHVIDGELTRGAMRGALSGESRCVEELVRAAEADVRTTGRYYVLRYEMTSAAGTSTLAVRTSDSYGLSAEVAVLSVEAVLDGMVRPGLHSAASVLEREGGDLLGRLRSSPLVTSVEEFSGPATLEEGQL